MAREERGGADPQVVKLKHVRLSFPALWEPKASISGGQEKYGADFIIDPSTKTGKANIHAIEDAIQFIEDETWGREMKFKDGRLCYGEGDDKQRDDGSIMDGYEGMMYLSAKNSKPPRVDDIDGTPLRERDGRPYGGCYVNALVRLYPINDKDKGGAGIFASLLAVVYYKDGDAFGSQVDLDSYMEDMYDGDDDTESRGGRSSGRSSRSEERGSSRRSEKNSRDDDRDDRRGSGSSRRGRDEEDEDNEPRRGRSDSGRRGGRDGDDDERPSRSRSDSGRGRRDEDDDRGSSKGRRSSRDDEDDDRGGRRGGSRRRDDDDRDDEPRGRSRRRVDDDDIDDDDI